MIKGIELAPIIGILVPIIVGIISSSSTSSAVKGWAALAISVATGLVLALVNGQLSGAVLSSDPTAALAAVVKFVGVVAVSAQTSYNMFIKPSGLSKYLQMNIGNTEEPVYQNPAEEPSISENPTGTD